MCQVEPVEKQQSQEVKMIKTQADPGLSSLERPEVGPIFRAQLALALSLISSH